MSANPEVSSPVAGDASLTADSVEVPVPTAAAGLVRLVGIKPDGRRITYYRRTSSSGLDSTTAASR